MNKCKNCDNEVVILEGNIENTKKGFCSTSCALKFRHKNGTQNSPFIKGHQIRCGLQHTQEFKDRRKGVGNPGWKGNSVTKSSLHCWIRDNFVRTNICEHCKKIGKTDWSNKDHKYSSRDRSYWQELCRGCHQLYDFKFLNRTRRKKLKEFETVL